MIELIECPRDAMQGWKSFIPTARKIEYLNSLLRVGFKTIDCGSFVSPKAIPQMADTKEVLAGLDTQGTVSKLLAIVANIRGAEEASQFEQLQFLGFPFSISETFQQRNTNSSIADSFVRVKEIQEICANANKELVVYISMGFGNPYGDPYSADVVYKWINKIAGLGVNVISLADTVGLADPDLVFRITEFAIKNMPQQKIGVHLHSTSHNWKQKFDAAFDAGCRRFDGALKGIGGCPMANDELVGNMDTELMIERLEELNMATGINRAALSNSLKLASEIFT